MRDPKLEIVVFEKGKVVITEAKKKEDIDAGYRKIFDIVQRFKC